jgi:hypothetical protein
MPRSSRTQISVELLGYGVHRRSWVKLRAFCVYDHSTPEGDLTILIKLIKYATTFCTL